MDRIDQILKNDIFQLNLGKNRAAEADRCFCRHDMVHFLDVARIARVMNAEEGYGLELEMIYAAAILHDIGKHRQYLEGSPHEIASGEIAPDILRQCGFSEEETLEIRDAILAHRDRTVMDEKNLRGILYRADKASRACYACDAEKDCNWKNDKKNLKIVY